MRFRIEVRWPPVDNDPDRGREALTGLWYHDGNCHVADALSPGDKALIYETKAHPETGAPGAQAIVAWGVVTGLSQQCKEHCVGDHRWNTKVPFEVKQHVPWGNTGRGVPVETVRKVLSWKESAPLMKSQYITEEEFNALAAELNERCR